MSQLRLGKLLVVAALLVCVHTAFAQPRYDVLHYGNFGGVGWSNGAITNAVDDLDRCFYRHDEAATTARLRYEAAYRTALRSGRLFLARQFWMAWRNELCAADLRLASDIRALPPLQSMPSGLDNWNRNTTHSMPKSVQWRRDWAARAKAAAATTTIAEVVIRFYAGPMI